MKRVFLASPYAGDVGANIAYARSCLLDSLRRGEAPFAPHLIYPQALDDSVPADRAIGIRAGLAWMAAADAVAIYTDRGVSPGMAAEEAEAWRLGIPVERRTVKPGLTVDPAVENTSSVLGGTT